MEIIKDKFSKMTEARVMTKEAMQLDFEYEMAQKLTQHMYKSGMISVDEMHRISELNKKKFYPFYKDIM